MTWILMILVTTNAGVSVTIIPGYKTKDACFQARQEIIEQNGDSRRLVCFQAP